MPELDILYMTRVQKERFLDEEEFERVKDSFVLDARETRRPAKEDMVILHPLPRVNEITRAVDNDPRAAYFRQVENGKFVRMALIYTLLQLGGRTDRRPHYAGLLAEAVRRAIACAARTAAASRPRRTSTGCSMRSTANRAAAAAPTARRSCADNGGRAASGIGRGRPEEGRSVRWNVE